MPTAPARLGALLLALTSPALISASPGRIVAAAETSPFLGLWELDLTRMPATYGPAPNRVTFSFEDIGSGTWRSRIEITAPDGNVRRIAIEYRRDGKATQSQGDNEDGDTAAFYSPAPNVLVMNIAKNKGPAGVRVYTVSADGKEMTEAAAGINAEGEPFVRNFYFRRVG